MLCTAKHAASMHTNIAVKFIDLFKEASKIIGISDSLLLYLQRNKKQDILVSCSRNDMGNF